MKTPRPVFGLLVAGGHSRRMGRDKSLLEVDGMPLWQRQLKMLSAMATQVAVAAPQRPQWLPEDIRLIADEERVEGPLAGLIAGLRWAETGGARGLLALAVDLPRLDAALLESMVNESTPGCGVVCRTQGGYEPLCAFYPAEALTCALKMAKAGDWKLQNLVARLVEEHVVKPRKLSKPETLRLLNINTPGDWEKCRPSAVTLQS